jgi:ankyrin repeat protein
MGCEESKSKQEGDQKEILSKGSTEAPASQVSDAKVKEAPKPKKPNVTPPSHSAIRWGKKPIAELEEIVGDDVECSDPGNGNRPIHIAAQNGHLQIVQWLITKKCNVDAQNSKGATALHMAVAYDMYFVVEALLAGKADPTIKNEAGNEAITGLDGDKTGADAWDSGFSILQSANTAAMAEAALEKIAANPEGIDKAKFAQTGMKKKKEIKDFPKDKFTELMKTL